MDLKKSRDTFWLIDGVFLLSAIGSIAFGIYLAIQLFVYKNPNIVGTDETILFGFYSYNRLTSLQTATATTLCALPRLLVWGFDAWHGSRIFYDLSEGMTPFSKTTQRRLDLIAKSMLGLAVLYPIMYSISATLIAGTFQLIIHIKMDLILGLVLSSISAIFRYAISLQELADDTV